MSERMKCWAAEAQRSPAPPPPARAVQGSAPALPDACTLAAGGRRLHADGRENGLPEPWQDLLSQVNVFLL